MELRQILRMYAELKAKENEEFGKAYNNPNKDLGECILFIQHKMFEKAKAMMEENESNSSSIAIAPSDDEVFGLLEQYYMDADLKVEGNNFSDVRLVSLSATSFSEEEKAEMRKEAIKKYQDDMIAQMKKRDEEAKAKKAKKAQKQNPVLIPDTPATNGEGKQEDTETPHVAMQLSLF